MKEKNVSKQIDEAVIKRVAEERQTDFKVLADVKLGQQDNARILKEHSFVHEKDLKNVNTAINKIDSTLQKHIASFQEDKEKAYIADLALMKLANKISTQSEGINKRLDVLNGQVPKHGEAIVKLTVLTEDLMKDKDNRDEDSRAIRNLWWKQLIGLVGIIGVAAVVIILKTAAPEVDIQEIAELVSALNQ